MPSIIFAAIERIVTNSISLKRLKIAALFTVSLAVGSSNRALAQGMMQNNGIQRDTASNKSNNNKWKNGNADVQIETPGIEGRQQPDTSIHTFHRRPFVQPWYRDLGNVGAPALNLQFTPENRVGPTLGYHAYNIYKFDVDSIKYYNTTNPYTVFSYQVAGRLENVAQVLHTQNVKPNWNIAAEYHKIVTPGYYKIQRNNHDNLGISTKYTSLSKRYVLYGGIAYNKLQTDENGGVLNVEDLADDRYNDKRTVNTVYQSNYSSLRSAVSNVNRTFTARVKHAYTWGKADTVYSKTDTAAYSYEIKQRFSITHTSVVSTEKHTYKDLAPDSMRYVQLFNRSFANIGNGYYNTGNDSVATGQQWLWTDNNVQLTAFAGKRSQMTFNAGIGVRTDQFTTSPVSVPIVDSPGYAAGRKVSNLTNTYLLGNIANNDADSSAWRYNAGIRFYWAGANAGDFLLDAAIARKVGKTGLIKIGMNQTNGSAPYSLTNYENMYVERSFDFKKEQINTLYFSISLPKYNGAAGARLYSINNYIYLNNTELPDQYTSTFSVAQLYVRKMLRVGSFYLDNELVYQASADNAPINIPTLMGRHQISFERGLFANAIRVAIGVEGRYNSTYTPAGYSAPFNRYFYQNTVSVSNQPELAAFFNFRIKRLRAFIMGDNLNQLFSKNTILFAASPAANFQRTGRTFYPVYAAQNTLLRIGFSWVMVN